MVHFFRFLFSRAFLINGIIIILLLVGGVYATLYYLDDYTLHGETLEVPNVLDKNLEEALAEAGMSGEFELIVTDSIFKKGQVTGTVAEQTPKPGETVKKGRKIYLTLVASRPPQITMPRLTSRSLRQATSLMETYGLVVGELIYKPDFCQNCILDQLIDGEHIETGTRIERGSTIDLIIGRGLSAELTPIPYLIGMNVENAQLLLQAKSLNVGAFIFDESVLTQEDSVNAVIYNQEPKYSQTPVVRMGASVDLFLSLDTNKLPVSVNEPDSL